MRPSIQPNDMAFSVALDPDVQYEQSPSMSSGVNPLSSIAALAAWVASSAAVRPVFLPTVEYPTPAMATRFIGRHHAV